MTAYTWATVTPLTAGQRTGWALLAVMLTAGTVLVLRDAYRIIAAAAEAKRLLSPPPQGSHPYPVELWSTSQPPGQRVEDKTAWAIEWINAYAPHLLVKEVRGAC